MRPGEMPVCTAPPMLRPWKGRWGASTHSVPTLKGPFTQPPSTGTSLPLFSTSSLLSSHASGSLTRAFCVQNTVRAPGPANTASGVRIFLSRVASHFAPSGTLPAPLGPESAKPQRAQRGHARCSSRGRHGATLTSGVGPGGAESARVFVIGSILEAVLVGSFSSFCHTVSRKCTKCVLQKWQIGADACDACDACDSIRRIFLSKLLRRVQASEASEASSDLPPFWTSFLSTFVALSLKTSKNDLPK